MVSFISAAFVVVKLQIYKSFCGNAASIKWPLLVEVSGPFLPKKWGKFAEILTKGRSLIRQRQPVFNWKGDVHKADGFGPFLGPIYYSKTQNIAKNQNFPKNYILMNIKYHNSLVPDKSQILYKIN